MPGLCSGSELVSERHLFGGAISCCFPVRFEDVSHIRDVPNNQEVFVDPNRDESIIVELLERKDNISDESSAAWFLEDFASEQQSADQDLVVENGRFLTASEVPHMDPSTVMTCAIANLAVSKVREGVEARNTVRVYLANLRLANVQTDLLVTLYEPLFISEHSSSANSVGAGSTVPAENVGCLTVPEIFSLILKTFKIVNWNLFG